MKKNKTGWGKKVKGGIFKLDLWADEVTVHVNILQEHSSSGKKKTQPPPKKQCIIKSKVYQEHLCSNLLRPKSPK